MLLVKTRLAPSAIAGIGLFADEDIKAGMVTWRFMPGLDQLFSDDDLATLPEAVRTQFLTYTYLHAATGKHVYCLDNARFMNHSDTPNTAGVHEGNAIEGHDIALRDIARGEELTCDYHAFDGQAVRKLAGA